MPRGGTLLTAVIALTFIFLWSSAFTSAKIALMDAPPMLLLGVRFLVSGGVACGIALAMGQPLPRGGAGAKGRWGAIVTLGLCQNTLYLGGMFMAMTTIPAGLAVIVASALPLVVAAVAPWVLKERPTPLGLIGLALGFGGVIWVMGDRLGSGMADPMGVAYAIGAVIALATGTLVVKRTDFGTGRMMVVGLQMLVGGLTLLPIGLATESFGEVTLTWRLAGAFAYIVVFPGIVATFLWFTLIARTSATEAATWHFLNPIFGVTIAAIVLGEALGPWDAAGAALVAIGILAVTQARVRAQRRVAGG
jgi:drug/metabolite transporter (DMT)-like permease